MWRRCAASNGEMRTSRCTPISRLQVPVGVVADDVERGALDARLLAVLPVDQLGLPAARLGEAQVHAQQHLRPVLRLGAAGARRGSRTRRCFGSSGAPILTASSSSSANAVGGLRASRGPPSSAGSPSRSSSANVVELAPQLVEALRRLEPAARRPRVSRRTSWASSGLDQKSGAAAFSLSSSSALRAASRSKVAPKRHEALRGGREGGEEIVAFGHGELSAVSSQLQPSRPAPRRTKPKSSTASAATSAAGGMPVAPARPRRHPVPQAHGPGQDRPLVGRRARARIRPARPRSPRCR